MKRLHFDDCEDLALYMHDMAEDGSYIVAALFYDEAIQLIRELLLYEDIKVDSMEVSPPCWNGYDREFYVSLTEDMTACVEPAFYEKYLITDADYLLVDADADSEILDVCEVNRCFELYIDNSKGSDSEGNRSEGARSEDKENKSDDDTVTIEVDFYSEDGAEQVMIPTYSTVKVTFPPSFSKDEVNNFVEEFSDIIQGKDS